MYNYEEQKKYVFTDEGQRQFLHIRDKIHNLLEEAGAFQMGKATVLAPTVGAAESWDLMACVDRLVELGEIREIMYSNNVQEWNQERIFVKTHEIH